MGIRRIPRHRQGGSSGIGAAAAAPFAERGALVAVLDLDPPAPHKAVVPIHCDVADDTSVRRAVEHAAEAMDGLDILVDNAGIGAQGTVEDNDDAEWRRVIEACKGPDSASDERGPTEGQGGWIISSKQKRIGAGREQRRE